MVEEPLRTCSYNSHLSHVMHKTYFNWYCILPISWIIGEKKVRNSAVFCKERFIYFDHPFKVAECNSLHQAFIAALKIAVKGVQNDLNPSSPSSRLTHLKQPRYLQPNSIKSPLHSVVKISERAFLSFISCSKSLCNSLRGD